MSLMEDAIMADARCTAFKILTAHPECLQDDTPLQDLIEDIALAIVHAKRPRDQDL